MEAYAKINIGLLVGERREDGFHEIDSYFHLIGLHDDIDIDFFPSEETVVNIRGNEGYLSPGTEDLMAKALRIFSRETMMCFRAEIDIRKSIPSQAGLGGGSSDAAAVLVAANGYYDSPLGKEKLMSVAAKVGSDVPFFVTGWPCAHVRGRGEILERSEALEGKIDVFMPSWSVETKGAYSKLDSMKREKRRLPAELSFPSNDIYVNDFELVSPRDVRMRELASCYRYFSMSGSGSAYFGLGRSENTEKIQEKMSNGDDIRLFESILVSFS